MASCSKDELPDQEPDNDSRSDAPQSTTMTSKRSIKVKVDDDNCQPDSQVNSYRQSSCSDDEAAIRAVIEQHGMSSTGTECRLARNCTDEDPFNYVFVETLQLLKYWLSEDRYFTQMLQIARWDKRQNLADLLRSFGNEIIEQSPGMVPGMILSEVLKYHVPCHHARILFNDMLPSDIEAMTIRLIETGFELIASRLDDHVLEARAASGKDALKCLFNILLRVITDYSYCVDILTAALDSRHETVIHTALQKAVTHYRLQRKGAETQDICQKLFTAAVRSGNSELVRMLLQLPQLRGYMDVNCVVDATTGDTALHLACRMGSTLINQSYDDDLYDDDDDDDHDKHNGALPLACRSNYYRFVAALATADKDCAMRLEIWRLLAMSSEILKLQLNVHFEEYVEVTQLLIQHGADVYARNKKGETALHVAASLQLHGDVLLEVCALCPANELTKDLHWKRNCCLIATLRTFTEIHLGKGQRPTLYTLVCNLFSPTTVTIRLLNSVVSSYFDNVTSLIRSLLQVGMDVNLTTDLGETALLIAANEASKCTAFCREMYTLAATLVADYQDREEATAFGELLRANVFTVVRELLLYNADWHIGRSNGSDLLNVALHSNQTDLLVELVRQGAQPVSWPEYLISVFRAETQSVIKKSLETLSSIGVTVDGRNDVGQTALHIAAERDLAEVVRKLISVGADTEAVDNAGQTPVQSAVESDSRNALVAFGSRLPAELINTSNANGQTALHIAASEDRVDEVRRLLDCGADIELLDEEGRSPLVTALSHKSWNSARAILDHRPDVVASSRMDVVVNSNGWLVQGWTVLHLLCAPVIKRQLTPVDIIRRVLDGGVAANVRDFYGNTPMHTVRRRPEIIQQLIEHGADVNAQNDCGQTPLHIAFSGCDVEVVRCLIQAGADLNARDDFYNTPFHFDTIDEYKYDVFSSKWKRLIPDLPQSVVQSDTLNMFGVPTVFKFMALHDSPLQLAGVYRDNFTSFHTTKYKDNKCKHLLSLHSEAAINTRNSFGQTLLHLERLKNGFHVERRDDSLHQGDGRGRTSWHQMFTYHTEYHVDSYIYDDCSLTLSDVEKELEVLRMFPQVPDDFQSKRSMLNVAGCNEPDDVGRTPLHYAAMRRSFRCYKCNVGGCRLYCKCCMFLFGIDSWFVQDNWGRTPMHYAYLNGRELPQFHMTILPVELTDVNRMQDIDGYTPKQMLDSYRQHEDSCQRLDNFERSCFDDFTKLLRYCKEKEFYQKCVSGESVDEHLKKLWPKKDPSAFVWNVWTELQYAYRDPDYPAVQAAVLDFMDRLVAAVGEEDHRFEGILHQVGSSFEGTRVGRGNEFDFNVELVNLSSMCDVATSPECPDGRVHLVKKTEVNAVDGGYDQFFDKNGTLLTTAVCFWFHSTWLKVVSWQKFWDTEPLFEIISWPGMYKLSPETCKFVRNITLRFNRPVNGRLLHYCISIEIVPVVRVDGWWPQNAVPASGDIQHYSNGCNFVFDRPRRQHGATHSTKPYARISFALAESRLIRDSPPVVRAAFMVAKQIIIYHQIMLITLTQFSSHTLKMATLWSMTDAQNSSQTGVWSENDYSQLDSHQLQRQVEAIFRRLWLFSVQDFVPSFFMPSLHVAMWPFEAFAKFSHTFLRRTYSDYRKLFSSDLDIDTPDTRSHIREALAYSFALLYAVSSHCSWSTDWVFPTIIDDDH